MDDQLNAYSPPPTTPFWREQFQVLLVAGLFLVTFATFVAGLGGPDLTIWLKDICQAFLYAFLAMLGVRRLTPNVGPATTESGDINIQPPAAEPPKEKKNENPQSE